MRLAFADPPYFGLGRLYADRHPEAMVWDDIETHRDLIRRLDSEYDGWVLCLHSPSLKDILPLCPRATRVGAWVKPFCSFKPGVNPAYAWEPVLFKSARRPEGDTVRDWVAENITLRRGLTGAKPREMCRWAFRLMGAERGDTLDDLFPGTGAVGAAWAEFAGAPSPLPGLPLEPTAA